MPNLWVVICNSARAPYIFDFLCYAVWIGHYERYVTICCLIA